MKRTHVFIVAGVVMALAAIVTAVILLTGGSAQNHVTSAVPSQSAIPSTSTSALPSYPAPDMATYAQILNGSDKATQAKLLLPEFRTATWSADEVVPKGLTLVIDQESFVSSGIVGQVAGRFETSTGSTAHAFVIWFQYQDGRWLIWIFEEVGQ